VFSALDARTNSRINRRAPDAAQKGFASMTNAEATTTGRPRRCGPGRHCCAGKGLLEEGCHPKEGNVYFDNDRTGYTMENACMLQEMVE
jgi:hypothetical protein